MVPFLAHNLGFHGLEEETSVQRVSSSKIYTTVETSCFTSYYNYTHTLL